LFMLPFITVLREGLEAVVFVGGVSRHLIEHWLFGGRAESCRYR
jgi:high-affinity Fe2+/Pb2+ permease